MIVEARQPIGRPARKVWAFFADARERAGLTQEQLAVACGTWQSKVGEWERGEHPPGIRYIPQLAKVLGISVEALVRETEKQFPKKLSASIVE